MKVTTFIRKKNKILGKYTGDTLVPKDQIKECTKHTLSMITDADACPYCLEYAECTGCPMQNANNECTPQTVDSTYYAFINRYGSISNTHAPWYD
ncbi:MAG: hypothetical protein J7L77_09560, partial [Clostridiales bacterium]|nr:hypothetical protein [Clostridiales bacterium]